MVSQCSRIDCDEPAVALFAFDAEAALVWLDPFDGSARGAGLLCTAHADALTPIRGWTLRDRRVRAPRLWVDRPDTAATTRRTRSTLHREPASGPGLESLPFDGDAPTVDPETVGGATETHDPAADEFETDPEIDRWLSARTPLLARAFASTRAFSPRR
jgi:hypothetical protein